MKRAADTLLTHPKLNRGHGPALVWFRSDLRTTDNPALAAASEYSGSMGGLHALFLVDAAEWRRHDIAACKVDFILRNVRELRNSLGKHYNIPLHVLHVDHDTNTGEVGHVVAGLCKRLNINNVFYNYEYEVDEAKRDKLVTEHLHTLHITCTGFHDQCVVVPGTLKTKSADKPFTVFTPFKRAWIEELSRSPFQIYPCPIKQEGDDLVSTGDIPQSIMELTPYHTDQHEHADQIKHTTEAWPAGEKAAMQRLAAFVDTRLGKYKDTRDFPKLDETSRISAYLSLGVISARQCLDLALTANKRKYDSGNEGAVTWISELCWREFYRHILVAFPRVSKGQPFKEDTKLVPWRNPDTDASALRDFQAWTRGMTGYPLVDAAMRCLHKTGWMHNRLRMLTAMFLTKDLLIWWPHGERWFMRLLIDGDLASNNGGWQWSASTGTDSQPYFRIFNPTMQSEKFDSDGQFIREWVEELRGVRGEWIHAPWEMMPKGEFEKLGYPKPIVDHKEGRERCLAAFKSIKQ
jgi:deoxyribodipyrimidine photo-lyase